MRSARPTRPSNYAVGREKIARVRLRRRRGRTRSTTTPTPPARPATPTSWRRRCSPSCSVAARWRRRSSTPRSASTSRRMVHGGQEFVWGPPVVAGDEIATDGRGQGHLRARRHGVLRLRVRSTEPGRRDGLHRHLDQHRAGMSLRARTSSSPSCKVTPDSYLTYRYAGASGDFNPIHIDEEFAKAVGLPGRILHGLWTMAQVARAVHRGGRRPGVAQAARGPVPRHGLPRAGDHGHRRRVRDVADGVAIDRSPRPSRTAADHPQRGGRAAAWAESGRSLLQSNHALAPPGADPAQGRRRLRRGRPARGLEGARRRSRRRLRPLDDPQRARGARGAGAARAPAHVGGPRADRRRLPLLRRPPAARARVEGGRAARGRAVARRGARSTRRCASPPRRSRRSRTCSRSSPRRRSTRRRSATSRCSPCSRRC